MRQLAESGLELRRPVTFLVGENGSGKSTLVEAIAEAYGINVRTGRGSRERKVSVHECSPLGQHLQLDLTAQGAAYAASKRLKRRSFFLRAETAFDFIEYISSIGVIVPGYWQEDLRVRSHGEGYLTVLGSVISEPGLYLLDEPEAALSFNSCLRLVALLHDAAAAGAQIICATHSPILAATPDADIIELDSEGAHHTTWDRLELVDHWRRYLARPDRYLRHLVGE
ncbi:AAA family ATPase [Allonocardiopsis opalescens]|uniref:AAA family ATPase n=1 Tax=Allonocardiopsis opalescens TaxID=1144618 RepID=UPI001FE79906|nr:AAA family ATPase [Allonocardiopsis opalescens]